MKKTYVPKKDRLIKRKWNQRKQARFAQRERQYAEQHPSYLRKETAYFLILAMIGLALAVYLVSADFALFTGALLLIPAVVAQVSKKRIWLHSLYALALAVTIIIASLVVSKGLLILAIVEASIGLIAIGGSHFFGLAD